VVQLPSTPAGLKAVDAALHQAWATFAEAVEDVDLAIVRHGTFGKNGQALCVCCDDWRGQSAKMCRLPGWVGGACITVCKAAKLSPDGAAQMAFQLAYYRVQHAVPPTYESCNMQHFHHGRTETIRSVTPGVCCACSTLGPPSCFSY